MENNIISINPNGYFVYYAVLVTIATTLGIIVYVLLRNPNARRMQFRNMAPVSKLKSLFAALIVAIPIIVYAHIDSWSYFYTVSRNKAAIIINYYFPSRTIHVQITDKLKIVTENYFRKGGMKYRIKIIEADQNLYSSQLMDISQAEANSANLKKAIKSN